MKVSRVEEMHAMDHQAIRQYGLEDVLLMENAGEAVYDTIAHEQVIRGRTFVIVCGTGNNGGDGLVAARKLYSAGGQVTVILMGDPSKFPPAAQRNYAIARTMHINIRESEEHEVIQQILQKADVIIDALFGTGLDREVTGQYKTIIHHINSSGKVIVSIDIPSGVQGDSGRILGTAVKADYTVTFGLPKIGNVLMPGSEQCGRLYVSHISFPPALYRASHFDLALNTLRDFQYLYPTSRFDASRMPLFLPGIAQCQNIYETAVAAFQAAGGSMMYLVVPEDKTGLFTRRASTVVLVPQYNGPERSIQAQHLLQVREIADESACVVIGPHCVPEENRAGMQACIHDMQQPVILAGKGNESLLKAARHEGKWIRERPADTLWLLHNDHLAYLAQREPADLESQLIPVLQHVAREYRATVLFIGAQFLLSFPDGRVFINAIHQPDIYSVEIENILSGCVTGVYSTGPSFPEAVRQGMLITALATKVAADQHSNGQLTTGQVVHQIAAVMHHFRETEQQFNGAGCQHIQEI